MDHFNQALSARIAEIRQRGLLRHLRQIDTPQSTRISLGADSLLNFSSNDYLGFSNEPALKDAAIEAVKKYGAGAGSSRLICGSLAPHHQLEETIGQFKQCEAALSFATGYAAALGTITALLDKNGIIILDRLVHASIVDAARLSGATLRVFAHNDLNDLESILKWCERSPRAAARHSSSRRPDVLIVTESVFSMDGDRAPLRALVELKERFGAWLMVDEAHAVGVIGSNRRGLVDDLGLNNAVEIQMGTLGKAIGASGGYICGSRKLIDLLINRARSFIFSTAPVPASVGAATAGIRLLESKIGADRQASLWNRIEQVRTALSPDITPAQSAIFPFVIGDEKRAVEIAQQLLTAGLFIPAIRFPTVRRGKARLRVTLSAAHSMADVQTLIATLQSIPSAG